MEYIRVCIILKESMKIIIISAFFTPEITPRAFRTTELVTELLKRNNEVTLYIPYKNYNYSELLTTYKNLIIKFLTSKELSPKLPIGKSIWKRAIRCLYYKYSQLTCYPYIKLNKIIPGILKKDINSYDLMISIAAPHAIHWGCAIALENGFIKVNKWIADCGDPFMGDETQYHPSYFKKFENKFCSLANYITVPIDNAINAYYPEYRHKIKVIPQGFDFTKFMNLEINYSKNKVPTFAYAGSLYPGYRDLNAFVDFLSTIELDYQFIIYSPKSVLVDSYKKKLKEKLIIKDFIPRDDLLHQLSTMDFVINIENKGKFQLPSKLIDYALIKRPVLSVSNSILHNDIIDFLNGNYDKKQIMPDITYYDIKNVVDKFLNLYY